MSGFGFIENARAALALAEQGKTWREEAFLQQLSMNGSMMLACNHEPLWLECLSKVLGQPVGSTWPRLSSLLRTLPAYQARSALWRASQLWWSARQHLHLRTLMTLAAQGAVAGYIERTRGPQAAFDLRAHQLDKLTWCLERQESDGEHIAIVEGSARLALRAAERSND